MDVFNILEMIGGLCLFLFGMSLMGQALERRAGGRLHSVLSRMTGSKLAGLMTGLGVTAVIQSSSAATVMVVGFVNSGLMSLGQSINVIMGANVGTTVTAWLLSLAGISGGSIWLKLLKPSSFTPVLALIGIILYMFGRKDKRKDIGIILLSFATLMFGMETMSGAVSGLRNEPAFARMFLLFSNPILGVLAGAVLTAVIQSSSASVGILQALASTGAVSYGAAVPIIMGQNIGTCVTALISSVGANKNAKRAAMVHLSFNVIGTAVWLTVYCVLRAILKPAILNEAASLHGIAVVHTVFNVLCTVLLLPFSGLLQKLVCLLVPDAKEKEQPTELDERLLSTPPLALRQSREVAVRMADMAFDAVSRALDAVTVYSAKTAERIRESEAQCDRYEDMIGTYLVKVGSRQLGGQESEETTELLKLIGDLERISDHAVSILESAEELREKGLTLTEEALGEYETISGEVREICRLSREAFVNRDADAAARAEPMEQMIDAMKEQLRTRHILRLKEGKCTAEVGFVWSDLLTNLEHIGAHCAGIAGSAAETAAHSRR